MIMTNKGQYLTIQEGAMISNAPSLLLSGTFGIRSRLTLNSKIPKEPSSPSLTDALKKDIETKIRKNYKEMINGQHTTCAKINCRVEGYMKVNYL